MEFIARLFASKTKNSCRKNCSPRGRSFNKRVKDEAVEKHTSVEKAIEIEKLEEENRLLKRLISYLEGKIQRMEEHTSVDKQNTTEKLEQENSLLRTKIPDLEEKIHKLEDQLQCTSRILSEKQGEIDNLNSQNIIMKKGTEWSEIIDLHDTIDKLKESEANLKLCLEDSRKTIDILSAKVSERDSVIQRMTTEMHAKVDNINDTEKSVNTNTEIVRKRLAPQVKADSEVQDKMVWQIIIITMIIIIIILLIITIIIRGATALTSLGGRLSSRSEKHHKNDNQMAGNQKNTNGRRQRCRGCYITY